MAMAALALLIPQAGLAQPPAGDDLFGMYANDNFDAANPNFINPADGIVQTYIILTNVSGPAIGAFEFALAYDGVAPVITDPGLPPQGVNFGSGNEFIVGVGTPLVPDGEGSAVLLSPQFFVSDPNPTYVAVTPTSIPTWPDAIVYAEFEVVGNVHEMIPASGNFVDPIFAFNDEIVENEGSSWSDVKSLYR
jgi:hypothetical protein